MNMAFDYKKEHKEFYLPSKTPGIVTVFWAAPGHTVGHYPVRKVDQL